MDMPRQAPYTRKLAILATLLIFMAAMTFWRIRDYGDKSIDPQVLMKLAGMAGSLVIPLGALVSGRLKIDHRVQFAWLVFFGSLVLTFWYAPQPTVSLTDTLAFLGCFLFATWLTAEFGETTVATILVGSVGVISVLSLIVYFVYPDLGRMHAWLGSEFGVNNRIQGVAGSPNGLGSMTSSALIFAMLYFQRASADQRRIMLAAAPLALLCLIMSDNRTGLMMALIAPAAMVMRRGNMAFNLLIVGLVVVLVVTVLAIAPDVLLDSISRTGDADEVTSGNGRSQIWAVVLEMIGQKPWFGHGYASATFILPLDPRLFSVAAHCHNMYLEVLFSGGVACFSLFVAALAVTLYDGFRNRCFEPLLFLLFFMFRGLTEPAPFGGVPTFAGYSFCFAIAFIAARSRQAARNADMQVRGRAEQTIGLCQANLRRDSRLLPEMRPALPGRG